MIGGTGRLPVARAAVAIAMIVAVAAGTIAARLGRMPLSVDRVVAVIDHGGPWHAVLFVLVQIGVAAFGFVPASLIAIAAGMAYGLVAGFALSAAGTIVGGAIAFLLSRSVLRPWIERAVARNPRLTQLDSAVAADGWRFVCLLRLSPVMPFAPVSYALGLTRVDFRGYMLGTLASLPALLGYVAIGTLGKAGLSFSGGNVGLLHAALLALGAIGTILFVLHLRRLMRDVLARTASVQTI